MNPWLSIPLSDYESHMASDAVLQRPMLDRVFGSILDQYRPKSLAVLGCSGGNGLEKLSEHSPDRVIAVDINPDYLATLQQRFDATLPSLKVMCRDLADPQLELQPVELIHAALIFEYLDPAHLLRQVHRWLLPRGILCVVLQLPAEGKHAVTPTPFESLAALGPIMNLVEPEKFAEDALAAGLEPQASQTISLPTGKSFFVGVCRSTHNADSQSVAREGGSS